MSNHYKYQKQNTDMGAQNQAPQNPYINNPQNMQNMAPRATNPYYQENYQYQSNPYMPSPKSSFNIFGDTPSDKLLRGLLIGGAAAYILTNEDAQKAIIKTGVKLFETLAGGVEEFKEKIMDAKAELEAEKEEELPE
ncbi:MAG TPA: YtxH domain-containing protein [Campylobacterales bacterium]|nr:YtxH domain-containing protein [Campylobacterales bacterium]